MGKLLSRLQQKFDHKIEQTTKLKAINEPLRSELADLYGAKGRNSLNANLTACLLNGLYTEQIRTFLFSVRLLQKLVAADSNLNRATIGSDEFKTFKAYLIKNKIIKIHSDSSGFGSGDKHNKAAKCELVDAEIIDLLDKTRAPAITSDEEIGDEDSDEQEAYERNLVVPELDPGLLKKMKERVKARKNKLPVKGNKALEEIKENIKNINIERSTYQYTVGWNTVLDNLDVIRRLCAKEKYQEALDLIKEMHETRAQIFKNDSRGRFPVPLNEAIKKCHKNK